jgi:hypothetical protein
MYTASFAFKNNTPDSASAADGMTALMIVATVNIALLLQKIFKARGLLFVATLWA